MPSVSPDEELKNQGHNHDGHCDKRQNAESGDVESKSWCAQGLKSTLRTSP